MFLGRSLWRVLGHQRCDRTPYSPASSQGQHGVAREHAVALKRVISVPPVSDSRVCVVLVIAKFLNSVSGASR
jgi:hypothetical protein